MSSVPRFVLIAIVLLCFVGLQSAYAAHDHQDSHDRGCLICSAGHLPVSAAVAAIEVTPPAVMEWPAAREARQRPSEQAAAFRPSRAPPVLSVSA